jgi:hypothetical protein
MENLFTLVLFVGFYAYISYSLQVIGQKLNVDNAWLAWIPIGNIYVMCKAANRPIWWIFLTFVPLVNLVIGLIIWVDIAKKLGKSPWLLLLFLVPLLNLALVGYFAFG